MLGPVPSPTGHTGAVSAAEIAEPSEDPGVDERGDHDDGDREPEVQPSDERLDGREREEERRDDEYVRRDVAQGPVADLHLCLLPARGG